MANTPSVPFRAPEKKNKDLISRSQLTISNCTENPLVRDGVVGDVHSHHFVCSSPTWRGGEIPPRRNTPKLHSCQDAGSGERPLFDDHGRSSAPVLSKYSRQSSVQQSSGRRSVQLYPGYGHGPLGPQRLAELWPVLIFDGDMVNMTNWQTCPEMPTKDVLRHGPAGCSWSPRPGKCRGLAERACNSELRSALSGSACQTKLPGTPPENLSLPSA